jgi:cholesterol transport system auxiliary component
MRLGPNRLRACFSAWSQTVAAKSGRVVLDVRQLALDQGTQVTGTLSAFGIDPNAGPSGQAVVTYDAAMTSDHGRTVRTRRFEARVPIGQIKPEAVGRALNAAANKVAEDVADWIAA